MSSDAGGRTGGLRAVGVSKAYRRDGTARRFRGRRPGRHAGPDDLVHALVDVDLQVGPGEVLGIVGPNGSGKSTLLKVVAGVTRPTSGAVAVRGTVGSMIELGLGFHPDLTGLENIWCSGVVLGFDRPTVAAVLDEVVEFSGLGDAVRQPLRTYSTGMAARLGFAVATHLPVSVLAVDEVLAVGDEQFQQRCLAKVGEMAARGVTVLFVSHEIPLVAAVCERAVQLRAGRIVDDGPAAEVVERYLTTAPSRFRRTDAAPARLTAGRVDVAAGSDGRLEVDLGLTVDATLPAGTVVGVDVELPTVAPGVVWTSSASTLGEVAGPAEYRLRGVSTVLPISQGLVRVATTVSDATAQRLWDVVAADVLVGDRAGVPVADVSVAARLDVAAPPPSTVPGRRPVDDPVVELRSVTKTFRRGRGAGRSTALDEVDLDVARGSLLGIIGPNGSGKSTLLRAVAGITGVDRGTVRTAGRVVPVLDLGPGFHPELTGLENVEVALGLLGRSGGPGVLGTVDLVEEIVDASGIGDAVHRPVRTYSSGMRARLGFAMATAVDPDVLLVDELLAVGDEDFRRTAVDRVLALRDRGTTVLFVSHDLRLVGEFCERVVRLQSGRIVDDGDADAVIARFGGPAWTRGSADALAPVRFRGMTVRPRHIAQGGTFDVSALVEVETADPWYRLTLSYRVLPEDRDAVYSPEQVAQRTFFETTVDLGADGLSRPGWYRLEARLGRNSFMGRFDLVACIVDDRTGAVVSDAWETVVCGAEARNGTVDPAIEFEWHLERVD